MVQLHDVLVAQLLDTICLFVNLVDLVSIMQGLSHIHKFDGILFISFSICGQMYKSKTTFSNLLLHSIVIQDSTEIERFPVECDI